MFINVVITKIFSLNKKYDKKQILPKVLFSLILDRMSTQ